MQLIKDHNPTLSPAINRTWIDAWGRADVRSIDQISHYQMTGRMTDGISSNKEINLPDRM
jgi:hypothetical protein